VKNRTDQPLVALGLLSLALMVATCKGDQGSTGPMGDPGATGPTGPTGPASSSGFDEQTVTTFTTLTTATTNIASVTVVAPTSGFFIVTGNGVLYGNNTSGTRTLLRAFLTTSSGGQDFNNLTFQDIPATAPTGLYGSPFSITRVFSVTAGSTTTFYLTADVASGAGQIARHNLTAIFVNTRL